MATLALALQTIPDIETGRRLHNISNLSDLGVAKAMFHLQQQSTGLEDLPLYLQKIVSIALAYEIDGQLHTEVLTRNHNNATSEANTLIRDQSEQGLLQHYVKATQDRQQITWQGSTCDFPILRYRALKQGIKWAECHDTALQVDLSQQFDPDTLAVVSLADISCLLDLPPLTQLSKADIWQAYLAEEYVRIDNAAKAEAANIYRIYQAL